MEVTFFDSISSHSPKLITLEAALLSFMDGTYKEVITHMRTCFLKDNNMYNLRKKSLPAIVFGGSFSNGHKASDIVEYNKIMVLDVDKVFDKEFDRVRQCLCNDPYTFAVWTSPSGVGVKALVNLEFQSDLNLQEYQTLHKMAFNKISTYFLEKYNIIIDKSGSDVCRLCFVSYDDRLFKKESLPFVIEKDYNDEYSTEKDKITPIPKSEFKHPALYGKSGNNNRNKTENRHEIARIIRYLKKNKKSITSTYEDWYRVGYAIANSFTFDIGKKYYIELCRLDGSAFDETNSIKMLYYCYEKSMNLINFATIIYLAELQGYIIGGSKGDTNHKCESGPMS